MLKFSTKITSSPLFLLKEAGIFPLLSLKYFCLSKGTYESGECEIVFYDKSQLS